MINEEQELARARSIVARANAKKLQAQNSAVDPIDGKNLYYRKIAKEGWEKRRARDVYNSTQKPQTP